MFVIQHLPMPEMTQIGKNPDKQARQPSLATANVGGGGGGRRWRNVAMKRPCLVVQLTLSLWCGVMAMTHVSYYVLCMCGTLKAL